MPEVMGYDLDEMEEVSYEDVAQRVRECLDECYGEVQFGGYSFNPSRVLEELDPVAFRMTVLEEWDHMTRNEPDTYTDSREDFEAREAEMEAEEAA